MKRHAALLALAGVLGLALLLGTGTPVAAHNVLIGSDPADGAVLDTPPTAVSVTFDLPVQPGFTTLTVTGPDGNQWQAGEPVEDGATVSVPLRELGPAGAYVIGYQVLSADGHPVRGTVGFTLRTPGTGTPAPPAANTGAQGTEQGAEGATSPVSSGSSEPERSPVWPWLAGAGALLVTGVVVALRVSRAG